MTEELNIQTFQIVPGETHTHDMVLGGQYGGMGQIIRLKCGAAFLAARIYSQLQLLPHSQSRQLLVEITVL